MGDRRRRALLVLAAILALAGALRFSALDFGGAGVPARPDEDAVAYTFAGMDRGQLTPGLVLYGGGYFYPLRGFVDAWTALSRADAEASRPADAAFARLVVARSWSALLSLATVAIAYALGTRLADRRAGLVAAAILGVSTLAVREAHFAKPDSAAAFAAALFLLVATHRFARPERGAIAVGAALAFAVSVKSSIDLLPAGLYALARPPGFAAPGISWRSLALGAVAAAVCALAWNPFWWTDPGDAWALGLATARALSRNDWLPGHETVAGPLAYHAVISARYGCGLAVALLALPAVAYGVLRGGAARVVAIACLGQWAKLLSSPMVLARFFLPSVPGLAALVAAALVVACDRIPGRPARRNAVLALLALAILAEPAHNAAALVLRLRHADTRVLAGRWIDRHLPAGARIAVGGAPASAIHEWGGPVASEHRLRRAPPPAQWSGLEYVVWHSYPLPYSELPLPAPLRALSPIAVFDPLTGDPRELVLEPLDAFYLPLAGLSAVERPGPRIAVYRLEPSTGTSGEASPRSDRKGAG